MLSYGCCELQAYFTLHKIHPELCGLKIEPRLQNITEINELQ